MPRKRKPRWIRRKWPEIDTDIEESWRVPIAIDYFMVCVLCAWAISKRTWAVLNMSHPVCPCCGQCVWEPLAIHNARMKRPRASAPIMLNWMRGARKALI